MKPFNMNKAKENKMKSGDWAFHGDVVIQYVEALPDNFTEMEKSKDHTLAYGELTGHLHQLSNGKFDLRIDPANPSVRHLKVVTPVALRHQEHKEIILPPGEYRTHIQREYDPFTKKIREVAD